MVVTAMFISFLSAIQKENEFLKVERYVNAVASFFIWFKLLYFFRVFRVYGHLIKTIVQVLIDTGASMTNAPTTFMAMASG
jgi:hypothetical protein